MDGWIKIYRKITENPLYFAEPFTRIQAWIDMLIIANSGESFIYVRGNKVKVSRGQIGKNKDYLAERWNWSRGKVLRFLEELEKSGKIVQQKSRLITLISIVNYDLYQYNSTTDNTTKSTTDGTTDSISDNTSDNTTDSTSDGTTDENDYLSSTSDNTTDGTSDNTTEPSITNSVKHCNTSNLQTVDIDKHQTNDTTEVHQNLTQAVQQIVHKQEYIYNNIIKNNISLIKDKSLYTRTREGGLFEAIRAGLENPYASLPENKPEQPVPQEAKPQREPKPKTPPAGKPVKPDILPAQKIVEMWNETCKSYPKIFKLSDARKNKIRIRLEEMGGEQSGMNVLKTLFEKMQASNFLKGDNHRGWKAGFDWVFENGKNWVKVYEGNYDNNRTVPGSQAETGAAKGQREGQIITPENDYFLDKFNKAAEDGKKD